MQMLMQTECGTTFIVDNLDAEFFRKHAWRLDETGEVVTDDPASVRYQGRRKLADMVHSLPEGEVGYLNGDKLDLRSENLFQV